MVSWPAGPETLNTLQSIHFFGNANLGDVNWQFKVDGGSYSTAVDLTNTYSKKWFADPSINPFGRELGMKFSESGGANQWRLDGFSVQSVTEQESFVLSSLSESNKDILYILKKEIN